MRILLWCVFLIIVTSVLSFSATRFAASRAEVRMWDRYLELAKPCATGKATPEEHCEYQQILYWLNFHSNMERIRQNAHTLSTREWYEVPPERR
jgi:hypothetical protein